MQDKAAAEEGATGGGLAWRALRTPGTLVRVERLLLEGECLEPLLWCETASRGFDCGVLFPLSPPPPPGLSAHTRPGSFVLEMASFGALF